MAPQPLWALVALFQFLIYTRAVGLLERVISSSQGLYPNTGKHIYTPLNIHAPKAGFEPAVTASERSKTVHALNRDRHITIIVHINSIVRVFVNVVLARSRTWKYCPRKSSGGSSRAEKLRAAGGRKRKNSDRNYAGASLSTANLTRKCRNQAAR
jgi:hypothetical protein